MGLCSLTNEQLLKFFIAVVDAELFKTVFTKNFKSIDIKNSNHGGVWNVGIGGGWVNSRVHLCYDPREQPVVEGLKYEDILTISAGNIHTQSKQMKCFPRHY